MEVAALARGYVAQPPSVGPLELARALMQAGSDAALPPLLSAEVLLVDVWHTVLRRILAVPYRGGPAPVPDEEECGALRQLLLLHAIIALDVQRVRGLNEARWGAMDAAGVSLVATHRKLWEAGGDADPAAAWEIGMDKVPLLDKFIALWTPLEEAEKAAAAAEAGDAPLLQAVLEDEPAPPSPLHGAVALAPQPLSFLVAAEMPVLLQVLAHAYMCFSRDAYRNEAAPFTQAEAEAYGDPLGRLDCHQRREGLVSPHPQPVSNSHQEVPLVLTSLRRSLDVSRPGGPDAVTTPVAVVSEVATHTLLLHGSAFIGPLITLVKSMISYSQDWRVRDAGWSLANVAAENAAAQEDQVALIGLCKAGLARLFARGARPSTMSPTGAAVVPPSLTGAGYKAGVPSRCPAVTAGAVTPAAPAEAAAAAPRSSLELLPGLQRCASPEAAFPEVVCGVISLCGAMWDTSYVDYDLLYIEVAKMGVEELARYAGLFVDILEAGVPDTLGRRIMDCLAVMCELGNSYVTYQVEERDYELGAPFYPPEEDPEDDTEHLQGAAALKAAWSPSTFGLRIVEGCITHLRRLHALGRLTRSDFQSFRELVAILHTTASFVSASVHKILPSVLAFAEELVSKPQPSRSMMGLRGAGMESCPPLTATPCCPCGSCCDGCVCEDADFTLRSLCPDAAYCRMMGAEGEDQETLFLHPANQYVQVTLLRGNPPDPPGTMAPAHPLGFAHVPCVGSFNPPVPLGPVAALEMALALISDGWGAMAHTYASDPPEHPAEVLKKRKASKWYAAGHKLIAALWGKAVELLAPPLPAATPAPGGVGRSRDDSSAVLTPTLRMGLHTCLWTSITTFLSVHYQPWTMDASGNAVHVDSFLALPAELSGLVFTRMLPLMLKDVAVPGAPLAAFHHIVDAALGGLAALLESVKLPASAVNLARSKCLEVILQLSTPGVTTIGHIGGCVRVLVAVMLASMAGTPDARVAQLPTPTEVAATLIASAKHCLVWLAQSDVAASFHDGCNIVQTMDTAISLFSTYVGAAADESEGRGDAVLAAMAPLLDDVKFWVRHCAAALVQMAEVYVAFPVDVKPMLITLDFNSEVSVRSSSNARGDLFWLLRKALGGLERILSVFPDIGDTYTGAPEALVVARLGSEYQALLASIPAERRYQVWDDSKGGWAPAACPLFVAPGAAAPPPLAASFLRLGVGFHLRATRIVFHSRATQPAPLEVPLRRPGPFHDSELEEMAGEEIDMDVEEAELFDTYGQLLANSIHMKVVKEADFAVLGGRVKRNRRRGGAPAAAADSGTVEEGAEGGRPRRASGGAPDEDGFVDADDGEGVGGGGGGASGGRRAPGHRLPRRRGSDDYSYGDDEDEEEEDEEEEDDDDDEDDDEDDDSSTSSSDEEEWSHEAEEAEKELFLARVRRREAQAAHEAAALAAGRSDGGASASGAAASSSSDAAGGGPSPSA